MKKMNFSYLIKILKAKIYVCSTHGKILWHDYIIKSRRNYKKICLTRNDKCIIEFRLDLPIKEQDYKYFLDNIVVNGRKLSDFGIYNNIAYQEFTESFTSPSDLNELIEIIDKKINYVQNAINNIHLYDFYIHTSTGETFEKFEDFLRTSKNRH